MAVTLTTDDDFDFLDPSPLRDGDLLAVQVARNPADPVKGWVPSYDFDLPLDGARDTVGNSNIRVGHSRALDLYGGHVAYSIDPTFRGRHYAERGVRLV